MVALRSAVFFTILASYAAAFQMAAPTSVKGSKLKAISSDPATSVQVRPKFKTKASTIHKYDESSNVCY